MGRWHADAIAQIGGAVAWVIDPDPVAGAALAARHPGARTAGALEAAALDDIDLAHLCTPAPTHVALATALMDAGAHVLVEKPFAPDAAATRQLLDAAAERRVLACPVHQYLFQRGTVRAGRALERLGALLHVDMVACSAGADGATGITPAQLAGEVVPHALSLLHRFAGDGVGVGECAWAMHAPEPGEVRATTVLGHASVSLLVSARGRPTVNSARLIAEDGTVHLDLFHGFAVVERGGVSRRRKLTRPFAVSSRTFGAATVNLARRAARSEPAYPGLRALVERFHRAVRDGGASPISPHAALEVARGRDHLLSALTLSGTPPVSPGEARRAGPAA